MNPELRGSVYSAYHFLLETEKDESIEVRDHARRCHATLNVAKASMNEYTRSRSHLAQPSALSMSLSRFMQSSVLPPLSTNRTGTSSHRPASTPASTDEEGINQLLSKAFDILKVAHQTLNPAESYLEAAMIFDKISMFDRAIKYYKKSLKHKPAQEVVDNHLFILTPLEQRKIERMAVTMREKYMINRNAKRDSLLLEEHIKREKALQEAHFALFRIYLVHFKSTSLDAAHRHLRETFRSLHPARMESYEMILVYAHELLRDYLIPVVPEDSVLHNAIRGTAGPLAEAHLVILHELYSRYDDNREYADWLGKRYAEKCNYEEARFYYKRSLDLRDQKIFTQRTVEIPRIPTTSLNHPIAAASQIIGDKCPVNSFAHEVDVDEMRQRDRVDYTVFDYKHEGASTVVFLPPPAGWISTLQDSDIDLKE